MMSRQLRACMRTASQGWLLFLKPGSAVLWGRALVLAIARCLLLGKLFTTVNCGWPEPPEAYSADRAEAQAANRGKNGETGTP